MSSERIELSSMIRQLREELAEAFVEGRGERIRLLVENVELELQVTVGREGEGKAGIKFWMIEAGAGGKISGSTVHKIKLSIKPQLAGEKLAVAAKTPERPR